MLQQEFMQFKKGGKRFMNVWIENQIGYLDGYSLIAQPDLIKITVDKEPTDFTNWRWDGINLIHDADNAPLPTPKPPDDVDLLKQQNAKLVLTQTNMQKQLTDTQTQSTNMQKQLDQSNKMVAKLMLEIEQLKKGDDKHAN